jgi:radical SAM protein with 4Fe4S-binding SPASM domain
MCPREKLTRPIGVMDMKLYKKIIDQSVDAGASRVSIENYGEPFLDPTIYEKAEYARSRGLFTHTITNGSLITPLRVAECFDAVRISKYGMTKKTYETIHRGLNFEIVNHNVNELFRVNYKTMIFMYWLMLPENRHETIWFISAYEGKASGISIWRPHNWGNAKSYRKTSGHKVSCGRPVNGPLQVQWTGKVIPCCFDTNGEQILGDFNTQTLDEIIDGEKYNDLREAHRTGDYSKWAFCNSCDQLHKYDSLVYSNIQGQKIGTANTNLFKLS